MLFWRNSAKFGSWDFSLLDQLGIVLRLAGLFPENAGEGFFQRKAAINDDLKMTTNLADHYLKRAAEKGC